MNELWRLTGAQTAAGIAKGDFSAREMTDAVLDRIAKHNPALGAFTTVTAERARKRAKAIDAQRAAGTPPGPLAGMAFSVKNLFDIEGVVTLAGAKLNASNAAATRDATLITRLEAAGAILVGAVNMGEYAYDFTGENAHYGPSRNPHDPSRMSGGSSGGSGTAVAAGFGALSLGSDTNGSIRVPSSFCGLFGLKPTYGRLSRAYSFPFVGSLDHLGPLTRSVTDLALSYDAMQGADAADPAQTPRAIEPVTAMLHQGADGLRIARATGYFERGGDRAAFEAVARVAQALGATKGVDIPEAARGRAAAFLITMAEGGALHLDRLRKQAADFDADTRYRLLAGTMLPASWVIRAQNFRRWYRDAVLKLFDEVDVILAPSTPCSAPRLGQKTIVLDGVEMPLRPNIGVFTQPISCIGLPVAAVPIWLETGGMPIGVQVIAAPWREDLALRVAFALERDGVARAPVANLPEDRS